MSFSIPTRKMEDAGIFAFIMPVLSGLSVVFSWVPLIGVGRWRCWYAAVMKTVHGFTDVCNHVAACFSIKEFFDAGVNFYD